MKYATREDQGLGSECRRRREGHDQHRGRRGEHDQSNAALFGVEGVRQPGIGGPRPPQRGKQEPAPQQPFPALVRGEEPGHLRDGEDEDEVEEQLERRDPLLALDRTNVHRGQSSPGLTPPQILSGGGGRAGTLLEASG